MNKDEGPRAPKSSEEEKVQKLLVVADLLCNGYGLREIRKNKTVLAWGLSYEQLHRYIKESWKHIHNYQKEELSEQIDKAIAERDNLKLRALLKKDFRTALAAMDSRDKIKGILKDREPIFTFNFDSATLPPEQKARIEHEMSLLFDKTQDRKTAKR